jgi:hypothetical protein
MYYRWIRCALQEFESICVTHPAEKDELNSLGFWYDPEGTASSTHIEFQVDDYSLFHGTTNDERVFSTSKTAHACIVDRCII